MQKCYPLLHKQEIWYWAYCVQFFTKAFTLLSSRDENGFLEDMYVEIYIVPRLAILDDTMEVTEMLREAPPTI